MRESRNPLNTHGSELSKSLMSGFPNRKSFARGLKAGLPSNIQGGVIIPLNHSSKPLSSEDACGKSVGSAIGRCAKSTIQAASPSNRTGASACRDRKTQWMSKRCPIPPCSARRGIKIDPHCVRRWAMRITTLISANDQRSRHREGPLWATSAIRSTPP
jgi:hypothetical protein